MLVPPLWVEKEPLLPRRLVVLGVRIPRPEDGARRQHRLRLGAAAVRQAVGDALHDARRPYLDRFAVLLVGMVNIEGTVLQYSKMRDTYCSIL